MKVVELTSTYSDSFYVQMTFRMKILFGIYQWLFRAPFGIQTAGIALPAFVCNMYLPCHLSYHCRWSTVLLEDKRRFLPQMQ